MAPVLLSKLLTVKVKRLTSWVQHLIYQLTWGILILIPTPARVRCSHLSTSRWLAIILLRDYPRAKACLQDWVFLRAGRRHQRFVTITVMTLGVHPITLHWLIWTTTLRRKRGFRRKTRDYYNRFYHYSSIYEGFEFVLKLLTLVVRLDVVDNAYINGVLRGNL